MVFLHRSEVLIPVMWIIWSLTLVVVSFGDKANAWRILMFAPVSRPYLMLITYA